MLGSRVYNLHRLRSLILALRFERVRFARVREGDADAGLAFSPAEPPSRRQNGVRCEPRARTRYCRASRRPYWSRWLSLAPGAYLRESAERMSRMSRISQDGAVGGDVTSAISDAMASLLSRHTGRGATSSWTTFSRDLIICVMGHALTKGEKEPGPLREKSLVHYGRPEAVLRIRTAYQESMAQEATSIVEELSGRRVAAFMSNSHIDPDLDVEIFILQPAPNGREREET
jgi:uncharacterized protein YbcI